MTGVFSEAYASAYDAMYADKSNAAECDAVITLFQHGDGKISRILDLGCGTGRHAVELAGRGFDVTGVDFSEAMLARARERGHSGKGSLDFVRGDARSYRSASPFDAVLMNFNVLGYMSSNQDFAAALATARANLRPGGVFVADFWYGPAVVTDPPGERLREIATGDTKILRCSRGTHDPDRQCIRIAIRVIEMQQGQIRSDSEEVHTMRYFFPLELEFALQSHGFRCAALTGYPDIEKPANASHWLAAVCAVAV
ncbi:class I SAM-dependent methyltransferase [Bradyrhizobium sp.]|uniref:class I SAM-dependent methyltransferase n=1 Tax=Bradyrhizobium sp. TaxID=376 RepID=UPI002601B1D2|nr:class I SAM-dependent methyltransferase [Bradyrhizobium sp.]